MSTKTQTATEQAVNAPIESQPLQDNSQSMQAIVNMIRRDSQMEPQVYLEESKVPHGGE